MTGTMKKRKPWFDTFKRADIGTGIAVSAIGLIAANPGNADVSLSILALYMLIFLTKKPRDEFAFSCWLAGCSAVFIALLVAVVIIPYFGGLFDGYTAAHEGIPFGDKTRRSSVSTTVENVLELMPLAALLAFFAGFQWRRFRGV